MSTQPTRLFGSTVGVVPQLNGLGLPRQLTSSISQAYSLIYSLRDALEKTAAAATGTEVAQIAYASDDLVLGGDPPPDIPGCTITLKNAGNHLITGIIGVKILNGPGQDTFAQMLGYGFFNGAFAEGPHMEVHGVDQTWTQMIGQWIYKAPSAGVVVKLKATKAVGTGISQTYANTTCISALWLGS